MQNGYRVFLSALNSLSAAFCPAIGKISMLYRNIVRGYSSDFCYLTEKNTADCSAVFKLPVSGISNSLF